MALPDIHQRSGYLFLAVILGHILLISAQVNSRAGVPVLEQITFGIFSEVQRGMSSGVSGIRSAWSGYVNLRHVKAENDALKRQLAAAQVDGQEQRALADRTRGLQKLLELRNHLPMATTAAEIIGAAATPDFRTVTIDKGKGDGLRPDMAVISPAGVVGRVVVPSTRSAKVQLIIDRNAAAGALVERSRAQGVIVGEGDAAAHGLRVGGRRHCRGRRRRDVGHRRDLSEGVRDRARRLGREKRQGVQEITSRPRWIFQRSRKCWSS